MAERISFIHQEREKRCPPWKKKTQVSIWFEDNQPCGIIYRDVRFHLFPG